MQVLSPTSLSEALDMLAGGGRLTPVAGGTDLLVSWHHHVKDDWTLLDLSRLHPRVTMLIAQQAYIAAVTEDADAIGTDLIRLGHAEARLHDRPRHQTMIDRIRDLRGRRTKQLAVKVIKQIARGEQIYKETEHKSRPPIGRAANALRDAGYIESLGRGKGWRIVDPLFRLYLTELDPAEP